ncbi:DUF1636 domain-containing protein [Lichenihabitans sp. Uapishka_5]|uniref:DUF1636 domain-containing protein n=1 Tax=Lichenihabitans sp. Uapishka_5 TaxID=3037302 RepID=UPI0029E8029C|nr:DUF1636 domain-containing protein [Lichenihabitans sp. Uapishka_5]MDX7953559.1 DUF1636 domain-containing protein [Lichenihabitans sp. Uapishka_5]
MAHPDDGLDGAEGFRVMQEPLPQPMRIYVCTTCRAEGDASDGPRAGTRLFDALKAADAALDLVPVECLSVCKRACTVSFAATGKWTYVYGDLPAEAAVPVIREAARLYAEAPDGLIPWKLRPDAIKKGVVARIPPLPIEISRP